MRILALLAFAAMIAAAVELWRVPPLLLSVYAVGSVICFGMYAVDKAAARAGRWRTSENTLLLLGLACGWPGAILAQMIMRHKSNKPSFKMRFWATVVVNVALFLYLVSPLSVLRPVT
jgi:uncharacterized membrane protein YsdA (DUF1294 family)